MVPNMADDRWGYDTLQVPWGETKKESEDSKTQLTDLAAEGWRLVFEWSAHNPDGVNRPEEPQ